MVLGRIVLDRPVMLAPMAGVTDKAFRTLCKRFGADYMTTEMASSRGICHGDRKSFRLIEIPDGHRPMAIQIFGSDPLVMARAAEKAMDFCPDSIDINMGCPTPKIVSNGDGAALMKNPALASDIVRAVVAAVPVPVTVKIRKGWDGGSANAVEFARMLEQAGASMVTVHARTRDQFYSPPADWDIIRRVKAAVSIPVIGNGDIFSGADAVKMLEQTGCDGVMIGRGALGNPWIFAEAASLIRGGSYTPPSLEQRLETAREHVRLIVADKGERAGMSEARKHIMWYIKGIRGAAALRSRVCGLASIEQMENLFDQIAERWRDGGI